MLTSRQIQARRCNWKLWKGHTPDGLERLRQAARQNRPWLKSTGPRTDAGKLRSRMNALNHGERSAAAVRQRKELNRWVREVRELLRFDPKSAGF